MLREGLISQRRELEIASSVATKHFKSWDSAAQKASTILKELGDVEHWTAKLEVELDVMERALNLASRSQRQ